MAIASMCLRKSIVTHVAVLVAPHGAILRYYQLELSKAQLGEAFSRIFDIVLMFWSFFPANRHLSPQNWHLSGHNRHLSAETGT